MWTGGGRMWTRSDSIWTEVSRCEQEVAECQHEVAGVNRKCQGMNRKWQCVMALTLPASLVSVCRTKAEIKWGTCYDPELQVVGWRQSLLHHETPGWRGDVMALSQQDHSWTWTVCVCVCVWLCYIIRAKFVFSFFYKQAGKSGHLCVYLISDNNINATEPLHVQLIKIKNHSSDVHMLRLHSAFRFVREASGAKGSRVVCIWVKNFQGWRWSRGDRRDRDPGQPTVSDPDHRYHDAGEQQTS